MITHKTNFFILTGAMGGGKSTLLELLEKENTKCIPEPARAILHEQRFIAATGVPEKDANLFTQLMLSRATKQYTAHTAGSEPYLFDRGIPDLIAYAELFQLDTSIYYNAAKAYRYNPNVFCFRGWEDIYTTDEERKMTYSQAHTFGERVAELYATLGYHIIEVPKVSPEARCNFILEQIHRWKY